MGSDEGDRILKTSIRIRTKSFDYRHKACRGHSFYFIKVKLRVNLNFLQLSLQFITPAWYVQQYTQNKSLRIVNLNLHI